MSLYVLFLTAVGLAMDAFAVAICKGLSVQKAKLKHMTITGLYFGIFQGAMPLIGYLVGRQFKQYVEAFDHWIAFVLLSLIGINMIREALSKEEDECEFCKNDDSSFGFKAMLPMAVATSIDALAVGVTYAFLPDVKIVPAVSFIAVITFALSFAGVKIGNIFGTKFKSKAEFAGGVILILIGLKILLEHLGVINF